MNYRQTECVKLTEIIESIEVEDIKDWKIILKRWIERYIKKVEKPQDIEIELGIIQNYKLILNMFQKLLEALKQNEN